MALAVTATEVAPLALRGDLADVDMGLGPGIRVKAAEPLRHVGLGGFLAGPVVALGFLDLADIGRRRQGRLQSLVVGHAPQVVVRHPGRRDRAGLLSLENLVNRGPHFFRRLSPLAH